MPRAMLLISFAMAGLLVGCGDPTSPGVPPVPVTPGVLAAGDFACGIAADRFTYCWGEGSPTPRRVSEALSFDLITVGVLHACGLTSEGAAWCWGNNSHGQLGAETTERCSEYNFPCSTQPVPVTGDHRFGSISAGLTETCAVTDSGAAYCWGGRDFSHVPDLVPGGRLWKELSLGGLHTCGIAADRFVYCWGWNHLGQLGIGTQELASQPEPVRVVGGQRFASVSAGSFFTCALTADGGGYCWGDNSAGQLGDGTMNLQTVPTRIVGDFRLSTISAGDGHVCGVAEAGDAYCWGDNPFGEVGDGNLTQQPGWMTQPVPSPVPVTGRLRFRTIAAGIHFTCGVAVDSRGYCWGRNGGGRLGRESPARTAEPLPVGGMTFR